MFRRIMMAIIRLCSYKGELNKIASSKWLDVEIIVINWVNVRKYLVSLTSSWAIYIIFTHNRKVKP